MEPDGGLELSENLLVIASAPTNRSGPTTSPERRSCRASVRELVFWLVPTVAFMTREQLTTCYHQRLRSHNPC